MKAKIMVPVVLAATLVAAGSAGAQQRVDQRRSTSPTGVVEIHNVAGSVRVVGWSRNEVHVTGELGRGTERLDLVPEGDRLVVRVVLPRRSNSRGSDIEVRVPARKTVRVNTISADVEARDLAGDVDVRTVSGDVIARGRVREVFLQSRSGDVTFDGQAERVHAESVSGGVSVAGTVRDEVEAITISGDMGITAAAGQVRANSVSGLVDVGSMRGRAEVSTVSGDLRVSGRQLEGSFQSVSGNIFVSAEPARDGTLTFESHSGNVEVRFAPGTSVTGDVTTFSGGITNNIPGARVTRSTRREQRFTVGRGEARVSVRTFSGEVKLTGR